MIVFSYSGAPSSRGLDHKLYGLSGVESVPGGVWVVLELEWGSRTPPAEFCRDHLTSPQPHPLLLLFFFLASATARGLSTSRSAPSPSFPSSGQWPLLWFRRRMPCLLFFCISDVMNTS